MARTKAGNAAAKAKAKAKPRAISKAKVSRIPVIHIVIYANLHTCIYVYIYMIVLNK